MLYVVNAFSLNMLKEKAKLACKIVSREDVKKLWSSPASSLVGRTVAIGHKDTARIVGNELGTAMTENRISVKVEYGDVLLVAQYTGPRLPEGATELPEGANIVWWKVSVE